VSEVVARPVADRNGELTRSQKAAAVLLAVGPDAAESVLAHMSEAEVEQVMLEVATLEQVPNEHMELVLREFQQEALAHRELISGSEDRAYNEHNSHVPGRFPGTDLPWVEPASLRLSCLRLRYPSFFCLMTRLSSGALIAKMLFSTVRIAHIISRLSCLGVCCHRVTWRGQAAHAGSTPDPRGRGTR
jgi:hypothetical protein